MQAGASRYRKHLFTLCIAAAVGRKEKTVSHYAGRVCPFFRVKVVIQRLVSMRLGSNRPVRLVRRKQYINVNDTEREEAISYRKPMAVKEVVYFPAADGAFARCPRCRITMEREYVCYCDRCGQCLDWDSYDDAIVVIHRGIKLE